MGDGLRLGHLPASHRVAGLDGDNRIFRYRPGRRILEAVGDLLPHRASGGQQHLLGCAGGQKFVELFLHLANEGGVGLDVDSGLRDGGWLIGQCRDLRGREVGGGVAQHHPARGEHTIRMRLARRDDGQGDTVGDNPGAVLNSDAEEALRRVDEAPCGKDPEARAGVFHSEGRGALAASDRVTV